MPNQWAKRNYTPPDDREWATCPACGFTTDPEADVPLQDPGNVEISLNAKHPIVHTECLDGRGPDSLARYMA